MGRWRWTLGQAIFWVGFVAVMQFIWPGRAPGLLVLLPGAVGLAFHAGQMRAEHRRLQGDPRIAGKRRPAGL